MRAAAVRREAGRAPDLVVKAAGLAAEGECLRLQAVGFVHQQLDALAPVQHLPPAKTFRGLLTTTLQRSRCRHICVGTAAAAAADRPGIDWVDTSAKRKKMVIHTECTE